MDETELRKTWRREAGVLAQVGRVWNEASLPDIAVRLPREFAELAVAAWERDSREGPLDPETYEQSIQRHCAATLSLIGLAITHSGRWEEDEVTVKLHPVFIGAAIEAADNLPG